MTNSAVWLWQRREQADGTIVSQIHMTPGQTCCPCSLASLRSPAAADAGTSASVASLACATKLSKSSSLDAYATLRSACKRSPTPALGGTACLPSTGQVCTNHKCDHAWYGCQVAGLDQGAQTYRHAPPGHGRLSRGHAGRSDAGPAHRPHTLSVCDRAHPA